jgi:hypothetical protein
VKFELSASGSYNEGALTSTHCSTDAYLAERWLSGRKQRFAKPSYGQKLYRGFESPPLRH